MPRSDRSPSYSPPRGAAAHRHGVDDGYSPRYVAAPSNSSRGEVAFRTPLGDVVIAPQERRRYPSRRALRDANTRSLRDIEEILSRAPWWDEHSIHDRALVEYYVDESGMLPDGLPGSVVDSYDFTRRCLVPREDLRSRGDAAWYRHIRDVYARRARMPCGDPIPAEYDVDMYCYRTYGEVDYVEALADLDVRSWRGVFGVSQRALCFARPLLRVDFRYASKSGSPYWTWVKWEHRMQRNDGLLISYHCVEYQNLRLPRRSTRYPRAPPRMWEVEMPAHCYVDSPPSLAYVGSRLMAPDSGWWVVYYTERTAKTACFVLWDVYDRHKLWRVPTKLIQWMRELDLAWVLGSPVNAEDLEHLLGVIEDTDWSTGEIMDTQAGGNSRTRRADDENIAVGDAEFIWYDPWDRVRIDERTANEMRSAGGRRVMPEGHPSGYRYDPQLPPVAVQALRWARASVPTMPSSQFYEEDDGAVVFVGGGSHRRSRMVLDEPAAKQRRVASGRGASLGTADATTGRHDDAGAVLAHPDRVSDDKLSQLRAQLEAVIREQTERANVGRAVGAAGSGASVGAGAASDTQMTDAPVVDGSLASGGPDGIAPRDAPMPDTAVTPSVEPLADSPTSPGAARESS